MSDGSYLESKSCSLPLPKDSLVWLGPRGNVWSKYKGSYGLILVQFFLSGGKISNLRDWVGSEAGPRGVSEETFSKHPSSSHTAVFLVEST